MKETFPNERFDPTMWEMYLLELARILGGFSHIYPISYVRFWSFFKENLCQSVTSLNKFRSLIMQYNKQPPLTTHSIKYVIGARIVMHGIQGAPPWVSTA